MGKYLDSGGLSHLMGKIKSWANGAFLKLSGGTMTGMLTTPHLRTGNTITNVASYISKASAKETVIWTGIRYLSQTHMPVVKLNGYAYGVGRTTELRIAFYIYKNEFFSLRTVTNLGVWKPNVYLFTYTKYGLEYVAIGLKGDIFFNMFSVDVQDEMGNFDYIDVDGWKIIGYLETGHIPSVNTNHCVTVDYGIDILNPPRVNSHTVNEDVPSNAVFTDTKYTAGTGLSLNGTTFSNAGVTGVKGNAETTYRTGQVNLTHANLGTTPIANGGTGKTTAAEAWTALGGGAIGKKNSLAASDIPAHASTATTYGAASTSNYGHAKLSSATNSSSESLAATPKAVKAAYDLASGASTTAGQALSAATGAKAVKVAYSISNGTVTGEVHVYSAGSEVTAQWPANAYTWSYEVGAGNWVSLGTGYTKNVALSTLGYGGNLKCSFNDETTS